MKLKIDKWNFIAIGRMPKQIKGNIHKLQHAQWRIECSNYVGLVFFFVVKMSLIVISVPNENKRKKENEGVKGTAFDYNFLFPQFKQ